NLFSPGQSGTPRHGTHEMQIAASALLIEAARLDGNFDLRERAAIERRVMELAGCLRERLRALGARLRADESPHYQSPIVAARFARPASELARTLKERGVLVSARHDNLRVSTHFYNNQQDIDRLAEELKALL
ncbi:MAG TPA: hypothetical protein PLK67_16210, partial [Bryobacteraceae bacterium]|nr:hypothetical protein [Bryobacteraceae bacterium]